jgi:hemerythrin-like metal-binding protein
MPNIVWSPQLVIGNAKIDGEHKELIRIANALLRSMSEGRSKNDFSKILHELREYTVFHFNNEEEFMRSMNYPDIRKHMDEHTELKRKVKDFQRDIFLGQDVDFVRLREMLKGWLVGHILECDLKIKTFLLAQTESSGAGATPESTEDA